MENSKSFSLEKIASWALVLAVAIAPVFFVPFFSLPIAFTKSAFVFAGVIVAFALFIIARLRSGNLIFSHSLLIGLSWLLVAAYLLSAVFSQTGFQSSFLGNAISPNTASTILLGVVALSVAALSIRKKSELSSVFKISAYVLGIVSVLEFLLIVLARFGVPVSAFVPGSNLANSFNELAILMGAGVIGILIAFTSGVIRSKKNTAILSVVFALALVLIAAANSSLVWILLGLFSLVLFMYHIGGAKVGSNDIGSVVPVLFGSPVADNGEENRSSKSSRGLIYAMITLVLSVVFLLGSGALGGFISSTFGVSELNIRPSWGATVGVAKNVYSQNVFFGTGPNTFTNEWIKYKPDQVLNTQFWNTDFSSGAGFIPTAFATTGLAGGIGWLVFLIGLAVIGGRSLIVRRDGRGKTYFFALASFSVAIYLFAMATLSYVSVPVIVLAFMFTGVFISTLRYAGNDSPQEWGIFFSRSPRIGFLIVFVFTVMFIASITSLYVVGQRYVASIKLTDAALAYNAGDVEKAQNALATSIGLHPSDDAYRLSALIGENEMQKTLNDSTLSQDEARTKFQSQLSGAVSAATLATKLAPNNYQNWITLGNIYQAVVPLKITNAYDNALDAYKKAQDLNPTSPELWLIRAQLDIANNDLDTARDDLNSAISLKNNYTQAIFLKSQLEVQAGNIKEALNSAESAALFEPGNTTVLFQLGLLRSANGDDAGAISALSNAVKIDPSYANARFFLASLYAKSGDFDNATKELEAISSLSDANAKEVNSYISALKEGTNPFKDNVAPLEQNAS